MKVIIRLLSIVAIILISSLSSAQAQQIETIATSPFLGKVITISQLDNKKWSPAIAYNSLHHEYLVVWENIWDTGAYGIYGQRVSESGELLGAIIISDDTHEHTQASVAYDPTHDRYLVVWSYDFWGNATDIDIRGRLVSWDGSFMSDMLPIGGTSDFDYWPSVAYGYTQHVFTVAWRQINEEGTSFLSVRQVRALDGTFTSDPLMILPEGGSVSTPDIAYNLSRNEWLLVWDQVYSSHDIYAVRLNGEGEVQEPGIFAIASSVDYHEFGPKVAACDKLDQYLVTYGREPVLPPRLHEIWMRYIDGEGNPGNIFPIHTDTGQDDPDIACNSAGNSYLITWKGTDSNGDAFIAAREADNNGFPRSGYAITYPGPQADIFYPAVGGGPSQFLIAWVQANDHGITSYQDIFGRTYTPYAVFLPFLKK